MEEESTTPKNFEIKGTINNGIVSLTEFTYEGKNLNNAITDINVNVSPIQLTEEQKTTIKTALSANQQAGKSKRSYRKRNPKRKTRRSNRK
jgi:hypothetical protein